MYIDERTYTDFNGVEVTEKFYFNLTQAEIMEMEYSTDGGLENFIKKVIDAKDPKRLMELFKDIVMRAYGVKSDDGKRFIKSEEVKAAFRESAAYSDIFMELATDADKATQFINGITPKLKQEGDKLVPVK